MVPPVRHIRSSSAVPASADVVIVGGGLIGLTTAMFLAQAGQSCVVFEKGRVGAEQSGRNAGWVRQQGRDVREVALSIESLRLWRETNDILSNATGFALCGSLYGFRNEAELQAYAPWMAKARDCGLAFEVLGAEGVRRIAPGLEKEYPIGLFTPSDGRAEPELAAPAVAEYVQSLGVPVIEGCAVKTIERTAGAVSRVVTERGSVACSHVVVAAGAWSSLMLRSLGIRLPQLKAMVSMAKTQPFANGHESSVWVEGLSSRRCADGRLSIEHGGRYVADIVPDSFRYLRDFWPVMRAQRKDMTLRLGGRMLTELGYESWWRRGGLTPFERERVLDPAPVAVIEAVGPRLSQLMEGYDAVRYTDRWAGYVDVLPDAVPVISNVAAVPGLTISTGYSGHGFGLSFGGGRLTADLVLGRPPVVDPSDFSLSRFS